MECVTIATMLHSYIYILYKIYGNYIIGNVYNYDHMECVTIATMFSYS